MPYPMHIFGSLHELTHVKLYMTWGQLDTFVFEKASEVMVHVWKNHVHRDGSGLAWNHCLNHDHRHRELRLTSNNNHVNDVDDTWVFERLKNLDFSEGSDRHPFLLVVHENPLEGNDVSRTFLDCLMNFAGEWSRWRWGVGAKFLPKRSFSQLGRNVIIVNRGTTRERAIVSQLLFLTRTSRPF